MNFIVFIVHVVLHVIQLVSDFIVSVVDGLTLLCPKGSAACRVTDEDTVTAMGQPGDAVIFTGMAVNDK